MAEYKPGAGSPLTKEQAQLVGSTLEAMGQFTPDEVVDAARSKDSVFHPYFTWNVNKAAYKCWVSEARHLVNTLEVVVKTVGGKLEQTKAFHSISVPIDKDGNRREPRYVAIKIVAASQYNRDQVVANALQELESWQRRYQQYRTIFGSEIFASIEKTVKRVRGKSAGRA